MFFEILKQTIIGATPMFLIILGLLAFAGLTLFMLSHDGRPAQRVIETQRRLSWDLNSPARYINPDTR